MSFNYRLGVSLAVVALGLGQLGCQPSPTASQSATGTNNNSTASEGTLAIAPSESLSPAGPVKPSAPVGLGDPLKTSEEEHPHLPGAHGGLIVPIGADSYHAEAIVEKNGTFRLLLLGKDESRIQEVELQALQAYVKITGDADTSPIDLVAAPQVGDAEGQTSQFIGQLPAATVGRELEITIPNLRIQGDRFRVGFTTAAVSAHGSDTQMPDGASADEASELYLTPGGKYTAADIKANGGVTAAQKFKGVMSAHDMKPKAGDRICPITLTKANPKFTWIVDGQGYEFCCPPCVDEFLRLAKEEPEQLKAPDEYIK